MASHVVCTVGIALVIGAVAPAFAQPAVWTAPGMQRVQPGDPPGPGRRVEISAARNEYEPFQVIVNAGDEALQDVTVSATDLRGPDGAVIGAEAVKLYREAYIQVTRPSYRCETPPGWWPDILVALDGPPVGPTPDRLQAGQPFVVPKGQNQPIWGEVLVPKGIPPGGYAGEVGVSGKGLPRTRVPITLRVWDFDLPDRATAKSDFGSFGRAIEYHRKHHPDLDGAALEEAYSAELIRHRLMPAPPAAAQPKANPDGSIDTAESHPILKHYIEDLGLRSIRVRHFPYGDPLGRNRDLTIGYLRNLYAYLEQNGWQDLHHIYILDEPNDAEAYEQVRQRAALVHEADRRLKVLCTEQTITSNEEWGNLYGAVDIWCPLWALYDEPTAEQRQGQGEEIWGYTALCQGRQPSPWWELDFPALNYRVPMWVNWRHGMTGLLYWTTCHWGQVEDPWTDPLTYKPSERAVFNGEGSLFYPGVSADGQDRPVPSLRLKMIREGMEDYEYLALLDATGIDVEVEEGEVRAWVRLADVEAMRIARSWFDWEQDPAEVMAARGRVAQAIEGATR